MDKIRVLFFGVLSEVTGKQEEEISFSGDLPTLLAFLKQLYPTLDTYRFSVAVNQNISAESQELSPGDEIALLPPFTGG